MSDNIKEFSHVNDLFAMYGELLTPAQKNIMRSYFDYNLSLSEISENMDISRPAVSDAIKKSTAKLEKLESKLHLIQKEKRISMLLVKIDEAAGGDKDHAFQELYDYLQK
jgi:uncharacterized protein